jgi:cytochrome P450
LTRLDSPAGTETTSTTLAYCIWTLSIRKDIMRKLQAELDEAIPEPDEVISMSVAQSLPYLDAVVKEGR